MVRWEGLFTAVILLGGVCAEAAPEKSWVQALDAFEKVRPGALPHVAPSGVAPVKLSAARGECESFQLLVSPGRRNVRLEAPPLAGPGSPLPLQLFREAFVDVRTPSNSEGKKGKWPDALVPLTPAREGQVTLGESTQQVPLVVWADVCVPQKQAPGSYLTTLALSAEGADRVKLPVRVEVLPFTLPATSSLPNTFGISLYSVSKGHGLSPESEEARELLHAYARMALEHRISLHGMFIDPPKLSRKDGKVTVDFRTYDAEMARYFDGTALDNGARFTTEKVRDTREPRSDSEQVEYLAAWHAHFREKGWPAQLFFYAKDEPKPSDYPLVKRQARLARRANRLPVLVTAALVPELEGTADILTPVLNCFFPREGLPTCPRIASSSRMRQALGRERRLWWYQSCMSHGCDGGPTDDAKLEKTFSGWASYMVDHPATRNRAMGPLAFLSGVDGELYFDTVFAYNKKDPWEDIFEFGGNGDGTLFYPGTPKRAGGKHQPVASIRLRHIRDGLEDYEYLHALAQAGQGKSARAWAERLTPSGYRINSDTGAWKQVRAEMAKKLTELQAQEYHRPRGVGTGTK